MLKLAGETGIGLEKIEQLKAGQAAGENLTQDSGDLEAGTKTITATAEASSVGNADYSKALTIDKPSDTRLEIMTVGTRLAVTIDSMTAGHLYCRVYVDAQDADHRLFDQDWTSTGAKLAVVDTHSGNKSTIFNLLADGSAHTFYFFFWVDTGNAVIGVVQLQEGVGDSGAGESAARPVLKISHKGLVSLAYQGGKYGTGTNYIMFAPEGNPSQYFQKGSSANKYSIVGHVCHDDCLHTYASVATDLPYISWLVVNLRSE